MKPHIAHSTRPCLCLCHSLAPLAGCARHLLVAQNDSAIQPLSMRAHVSLQPTERAKVWSEGIPAPRYRGASNSAPIGRYLVRLCDLMWAPSGRNGLFCRLPGRGGCLGGATTKWGGQGRPAGQLTRRCHRRPGAYVPPWPWRRSRFFPVFLLPGKWLDRTGAACRVLGPQKLEI
jgi:hypothetical protein